jgi:hypothetical protein
MAAIEPYLLGLRWLANRCGPIRTYPTVYWECDPYHADWSEVGHIIAVADQERSPGVSIKDTQERRTCQECQRIRLAGNHKKNDTPAFMKPHTHRR